VHPTRRFLVACAAALVLPAGPSAWAASAAEIDADAAAALDRLYARSSLAKELGGKAEAVLVFPSITKAGLMVGGQYGEGALRQGGKTVAYYSSAAASYGFQAGVQTFSYVMFLMNKTAVDSLNASGGWEVGVGPSVVVVDEAVGRTLSVTTARGDVYAFVFGQAGLMAGAGLQGTKITRIRK
jgi:lipid-binding SYLF domain-containing protein